MNKFNPLDYPVCLSFPGRLAPSAWIEHVPFAMFAVELLRPRVLVELGSHHGVSYCAFCQAVKTLGVGTRCYAVDTWEGDTQAGHFGQEVLDDLKRHHDPLYADFSRLVRSDFDGALAGFEDGSVDLLHIDGFHTYDAVRHDFETWLPKVSDRGVVLFHDTHVRDGDFGVWKFWDEVRAHYPHFEFEHGHGLGVLAVGANYPQALRVLLDAEGAEAANIREFFHQLGTRLDFAREADLYRRHSAELADRIEQIYSSRAVRFAKMWADHGALAVLRRGVSKSQSALGLDPEAANPSNPVKS